MFLCYDNHHEQSNLGVKRVYYILQAIVHHGGKPRPELEADRKQTLETACSHGLRRQLSLIGSGRRHAAQVGCTCSRQSLIRKMPHRYTHSSVWRRQLLRWGSSSQVTLSSCQVDKANTQRETCIFLKKLGKGREGSAVDSTAAFAEDPASVCSTYTVAHRPCN